MLYGNGTSPDFIGFSDTLLGPVSGRYEDYIVTSYKLDDPETKNNRHYVKTGHIGVYRNGSYIDLPIQELQIGDMIDVGSTYTEYVENITLTQECAKFDYFKLYTVTRNSLSTSISGNELKTGDIWSYNEITAVNDPVIKAPTLNIMLSNSGIHIPNCAADAILLTRQVKWNNDADKECYLNAAGIAWSAYNWDRVYTGDTQLGICDFTGALTGYKPHDALYQCLNWWEFADNPPDIEQDGASAHIRLISSDYGSYSKINFSNRIMPADSIKIGNLGVEYNYLSAATKPNDFKITQNPIGMPDYAGGMMLFSANEAFNENKLVGIGIKGIRFFKCDDKRDNAFKLYRFTDKDGYFKYLGNNIYYFNDSKMVGVKGHDYSNGPYAYAFSGPNFIVAEISAGIYTNASHARQDTININANQYINNPQPLSHLVYITADKEPHATSGKPLDFFDMGLEESDWYKYHLKQWDDVPNNTSYFSCVTFAPGIPLTMNSTYPIFRIKNTATELEFGRSMSAIGAIIKYNNDEHLENLTKINGDWHYCTNVSVFGWPTSANLFYNASALTTIPSSWEGLDNISTTMADSMFYHCYALTAIPSSFNHYGNKTLTSLRHAFTECHKLQNWLENWENLDNVVATDSMCYNCSSISAIPDSFEHLESLTSCPFMFAYCTNLREIKSWQGIDSLDNGESMFSNCYSLSSIPSTWNGINRKFNVDGMFMNCYNLKSIPNSTEWNNLFQRLTVNNDPTPCNQVVSMAAMFSHCSAISGTVKDIIDVFKTYNISGQGQFLHCSGFSDYYTYWNDPAYSAYLR